MQSKAFIAVSCACLSLLVFITLSYPLLAAEPKQENPVFARINDRVISYREFLAIFQNAVRNKYYHGEVPRDELVAFQRKVGKDIVEQILLQQEAKRLGLEPDIEKLKQGLAEYDKKYALSPGWKPRSKESEALMLDRLSQKDLLDQLENKIKTVPQPDEEAVREFYRKHPEKFTEPRRLRVSVILLAVPPSSPTQTWLDAKATAEQFIFRIKNGEDFAQLARQFSAHPSAVNGGDLGYLHQDMLEGGAQQAVDKLKVNELTPPVRVLEGFTIFKLNGIQEARLNDFDAVKERARGLLYRELQDEAWNEYLKKLTEAADIFINEKLYASTEKD